MSSGYINIPAFGGGGVTSLNSLTGAITLAAGTNITLTPSGNTITIASSGGGSGVTSLGAFGSAPNANGGSISGSVLTLQPADLTHPGGIIVGSQTLAMPKTFKDASSTANIVLTTIFNTSVSQTQPILRGLDQNGNQNLSVGANFWIYGTSGGVGTPILNMYDTAGPYLCTVQVDGSGGFVFNPQGGLSTFSGQITAGSIYATGLTNWYIATGGDGSFGSGFSWDAFGSVSMSNLTVSGNATTSGGQWIIRSDGSGYFASGTTNFDIYGAFNSGNINATSSLSTGGNLSVTGSFTSDTSNITSDGSGNFRASTVNSGNGFTGVVSPVTSISVQNGIVTGVS